jgi:hypothetical protein
MLQEYDNAGSVLGVAQLAAGRRLKCGVEAWATADRPDCSEGLLRR